MLCFIRDSKSADICICDVSRNLKVGVNLITVEWPIHALRLSWINRLQEETSVLKTYVFFI